MCQTTALRWTIEPARYAGQHQANTSVTLPLAAEELYFVAEGAQMGGHFEVSRTGTTGSDDVLVDIQAVYRREQSLEELTTNHMHSEDEKHGIRISRRTGHELLKMFSDQAIQFHIHVRLPSSSPPNNAHILRVNALSTDLPRFSHHLHRFGESVQFDRVTLRTSQCPIDAELLAARAVSLSTSNGEVRGTFKTSDLLQVDTSNARVSVDAALNSCSDREASQMALQTSNGPIQANICLVSDTPLVEGSFDVVARTTNGPLTVVFAEQKVNSRLGASLHTTNAPASVKMAPAFEGQFELRSSSFLPPTITESRVPQDRTGHGRVRFITKQSVRPGMLSGNVLWGKAAAEGAKHGRVEVQTTNAPLKFML
ncbi:hypothetical protein K466DRAFT_565394 [Polyporus arcularius HHB13444]|uniref:Uncharacterized protein n=1 Tax=Polyporus arcularius HHB13444 TaxID=1314778 RepID=A0A5C3PDS0_9APHY|nr:hypothetical protein K466DRAFT_565394 [Polyporus arcularius HHB13444]